MLQYFPFRHPYVILTIVLRVLRTQHLLENAFGKWKHSFGVTCWKMSIIKMTRHKWIELIMTDITKNMNVCVCVCSDIMKWSERERENVERCRIEMFSQFACSSCKTEIDWNERICRLLERLSSWWIYFALFQRSWTPNSRKKTRVSTLTILTGHTPRWVSLHHQTDKEMISLL